MSKYLDISMQRISTLDSSLIPSAMRVFEKCYKNKVPIYIVWGTRNNEQQELLYRCGRTIPGIVQTTRRAGYSAHNYGLALDFCLLFNTEILSWEEVYPRWYWRQKWLRAVMYFEEEGWTSKWRGSDFEPGHLENLMGKDIFEYMREANEEKTIGELKDEQDYNRSSGIKNLGEQSQDQNLFI